NMIRLNTEAMWRPASRDCRSTSSRPRDREILMLTPEKNRLLTEVGPGTPMGNLLRQYWMPVAGVSELDDEAIKPIRLMGEDLVLYRDGSGAFGLLERQCAHRRADLAYGMIEH